MSKLNLSKFLVIDLEGTCFPEMSYEEQQKATEIIQIGVTEVDIINKKILKTKSYFVKPKNTIINEFCTKLTGITKELVEKEGFDLMKVSKMIRTDFSGSSNIYYGAWGTDDVALKKECDSKKAVFPFSDNFLNIQTLYSFKHGLQKTKNLLAAVNDYGFEFEGTQHRADFDSLNTAKILLKLLE